MSEPRRANHWHSLASAHEERVRRRYELGTDKTAPKRVQPSALIGARLPKWAPYAAGVAAVVVALGLNWLFPGPGWGHRSGWPQCCS